MPDLSPEQVAQARSEWVAAGLDGAAFDNASRPDVGLAEHPGIPAQHPADYPAAQAAGMVEGLLSAGVSRDAISAALASDGFSPEQIAGWLPVASTDSAEVQAFDKAGMGGAQAKDYGELIPFEYARQVGDGLAAAEAAWAANLSAAGVSAGAGRGIVEAAMQQAVAWRAMTPEQQQQAAIKADADLIAVAGDEEAARSYAEAAAIAVKKMDPAFAQQLLDNGALRSPAVIVTLAMASANAGIRGSLAGGKSLAQTMFEINQ